MSIRRLSDVSDKKKSDILPCGFSEINDAGYLRRDSPHLIILGARPGRGKTLLAAQISYVVSKQLPVLFFSIEMSGEELRARLKSAPQFRDSDAELYIEDEESLTIDTLVEQAERMNKEVGLGLIVVDYVQIIPASGRNKAEEVGTVMRHLKMMAKRMNIPVLALAQLNRNIESRDNGSDFVEPLLSDFADSAAVESWADCALIMHPIPKSEGLIKVSCAKFRHGIKRDFTLKMNTQLARLEDHDRF